MTVQEKLEVLEDILEFYEQIIFGDLCKKRNAEKTDCR